MKITNKEYTKLVNKYIKKYADLIKKAKTEKEINAILNRIYEDGFEDGANEK